MLYLLPGLLILASLLAPALPAGAFAVDEGFAYCDDGNICYGAAGDELDVRMTLEKAPRWNADPTAFSTLADGIQVSIEPGFGAALAAIMPPSAAEYEAALVEAFRAWETPELSFDIYLDSPPGLEIDVFAVDSSHWLFSEPGYTSGYTLFWSDYVPSRELTNGQVQEGWAMSFSEIYVAVDRVEAFFSLLLRFGFEESNRLTRFQNFMTHEIGHAMGLEHLWTNFDTDLDPLNEMVIDPLDPASGMMFSPNRDDSAIMVPVKSFEALLFTELTPDDRGGMEVLYPSPPATPEPTTALLLACGLVGLGMRRRLH